MEYTYIEGPTAPPLTVTIDRAEYDQIKKDIADLFDCHSIIRDAHAFIISDNQDEITKTELVIRMTHFVRDLG